LCVVCRDYGKPFARPFNFSVMFTCQNLHPTIFELQ
jgi:hypothetical protein